MVGIVNVDVGSLASGFFGLIDELFTSDDERAVAKHKFFEMVQRGDLAQIAVNVEEAKSENLFVSGWRPFVGWACAGAMVFNFIALPLFGYAATLAELPPAPAPLDLSEMMPVLLGMLGLGGLRTVEKYTGTNKRR